MELILLFLIWLVLGGATAYLASRKGRDPLLWSLGVFSLGLFDVLFALIPIVFLYFLPTIDDEIVDKDVPELVSAPPIVDTPLALEWFFYDKNKQQRGPCSLEELKLNWSHKNLSADSFVWAEGVDGWKKVQELPKLFETLNAFPLKTVEELDK